MPNRMKSPAASAKVKTVPMTSEQFIAVAKASGASDAQKAAAFLAEAESAYGGTNEQKGRAEPAKLPTGPSFNQSL